MLKTDLHVASKLVDAPRLVNKIFDYAREYKYYWSNDKKFLLMKYLARFIAVRERAGTPCLPNHETLQKALSTTLIQGGEQIGSILEALSREGYYQGFSLPDSMVEDFLRYAFSHPCYANRKGSGKPIYLTPEVIQSCPAMPFKVASYIQDQENCPLIRQLAKDPLILAIAEAYLGNTPIYHRSELLWSFPHQHSSESCYTHFFHCDINDYRNIKFFFYLTDVDEASGPHFYIKTSHKKRSLIKQLRGASPSEFSDRKLARHYGEDAIKAVTGSAGLGFVGDPYTLHRGSDANSKARLMLQIEFTVSQYRCWYYNRYKDPI